MIIGVGGSVVSAVPFMTASFKILKYPQRCSQKLQDLMFNFDTYITIYM